MRPGPLDIHLLAEGTHTRLHEFMGAHVLPDGGGVSFILWAPSARQVLLRGDFNGWGSPGIALARRQDGSGLWQVTVPNASPGQCYRFWLEGPDGHWHLRGDPFAFGWETPPRTAPRIIAPTTYSWGDAQWMLERARRQSDRAPISIYEMHAGSWRRDKNGRWLGWGEIAQALAEHANQLGFTHVELMPVTEHPFDGSWGYQCTGYFAPTARHGPPEAFMAFVDILHQHGVGVILDWVPGHFPDDAHGLACFDGTHLYDHADPRQGHHPDWGTRLFNYERHEVRSFLLSSAHFWIDRFHLDGLRVDGVASMLYLDYSRQPGQWIPNAHGGRENLGAIAFLRQLTASVTQTHPGVLTWAEESTAWPGVTHPTAQGGLGFDRKWNLGWMNDTLRYLSRDPVHRAHHHGEITFSIWYAWAERFLLPLSHDEVVHGKGSLIGRMPGTWTQRLSTLRVLFGLQWAHPGAKLLFMGGEFAQRCEWSHDHSLDWAQAAEPGHRDVMTWIADLNRLYRNDPALHEADTDPSGFEWVLADDASRGVLAFIRRAAGRTILFVCNLTPVTRERCELPVPVEGDWVECLNSDALEYGGTGQGNLGRVRPARMADAAGAMLEVFLPGLTALFLRPETCTARDAPPDA